VDEDTIRMFLARMSDADLALWLKMLAEENTKRAT